MNPGRDEAQEVPVDVLPPVPHDAQQVWSAPGEPPLSGLNTFYHPASGMVILGIDFIVFGLEFVSGFLDLPFMCILAFIVTLPLVYRIQTKWGGDKGAMAFIKAFAGAIMAGLPFSIMGTLYGAAILALSGLPHHPVEMLKRLLSGQGPIRPIK